MTLYARDFHAWANQQAALARSRAHNEIDWDNVAEELDSLGRQQRAELRSHYRVLLMHLLKWRYQPNKQGPSWQSTIVEQRTEIADHMADNPSLKSSDAEVFAAAYKGARAKAAVETGMPEAVFPIEPPFTPEQSRDPDFWPDAWDGHS